MLQKGYGAVCSSTVQCSTALKLVCSTVNDQSYGPTSLAMNHCDCLVSQYYDTSLGCGIDYFISFKITDNKFGINK